MGNAEGPGVRQAQQLRWPGTAEVMNDRRKLMIDSIAETFWAMTHEPDNCYKAIGGEKGGEYCNVT